MNKIGQAADKNLPPLTLPSPPLSRCAGGGEGAFESAARFGCSSDQQVRNGTVRKIEVRMTAQIRKGFMFVPFIGWVTMAIQLLA